MNRGTIAENKKIIAFIGGVTAIAGLLTAIINLGGSVDKNSGASDGNSTASPPLQETVNTSKTPTAGTTGAATPAPVYFHGHLEFGNLNLDLNPPKQTGNTYINGGGGDTTAVFQGYGGAGILAVWTSSGIPDRTGCSTAVDERGSEYIYGVEKDTHVCGRTGEGRIFRIDVTAISDALFGGVTGDVTVWEK